MMRINRQINSFSYEETTYLEKQLGLLAAPWHHQSHCQRRSSKDLVTRVIRVGPRWQLGLKYPPESLAQECQQAPLRGIGGGSRHRMLCGPSCGCRLQHCGELLHVLTRIHIDDDVAVSDRSLSWRCSLFKSGGIGVGSRIVYGYWLQSHFRSTVESIE